MILIRLTCSVYVLTMENDSSRIAAALEDAPIVARLALTSANERVRARTAAQLGEHIAHKLAQPEPTSDARQLCLL